MKIKKIRAKNFKSFKDIEVELGDFNVVIGPNASGKSNFIQIFKFLRDVCKHGLKNAVSMQGGVEYLRNLQIGKSENLEVDVTYVWNFNCEYSYFDGVKLNKIDIFFKELNYNFELEFVDTGSGFNATKEHLRISCLFHDKEPIDGEIVALRSNDQITTKIIPEVNKPIDEKNIFMPSLENGILKKESYKEELVFASKPLLMILDNPVQDVFKNIIIYDIDPKSLKKASLFEGKAELEEDGSNLPIVINNLFQNPQMRKTYINLIHYVLPYVRDIQVEKYHDKYLILKLKEDYTSEYFIPAYFVSEGTINIISTIFALYFDKKPFVIIEEPDRYLHPSILSKLIEMMKEVSKDKQIICTTHNPEIIKYAGFDNLICISRKRDLFSHVFVPKNSENIKIFLQNEIGIDELHINNLLSI